MKVALQLLLLLLSRFSRVRLCDPMDCSPPGSPVPGILQARTLEWPAMPSPGDCPYAGIEPRSPTLWADALPSEPPGKPKNTAVGSLSLLQGIFPTQKSNQGVLHCGWVLYQLSYQGSHWCYTLRLYFTSNAVLILIAYSLNSHQTHTN